MKCGRLFLGIPFPSAPCHSGLISIVVLAHRSMPPYIHTWFPQFRLAKDGNPQVPCHRADPGTQADAVYGRLSTPETKSAPQVEEQDRSRQLLWARLPESVFFEQGTGSAQTGSSRSSARSLFPPCRRNAVACLRRHPVTALQTGLAYLSGRCTRR